MRKVNFQPDRMNTVNAYLMVESVQKLIDFTKEVYKAKLNYKLNRPDGKIMHAEIQIGDSVIMAGEPMGDFKVFPCSLYVYVSDCDRVYQRALEYGCQSIMQPLTMKHAGERYGGVKDQNGNIGGLPLLLKM